MNLSDQQVVDIVLALLRHEGIYDVGNRLREGRAGAASLPAMKPILDRYWAIVEPPRLCRVEHAHWEGAMICGNPLPCRTHGGG
jgi:hypothetical protein